MVPASNNRSGRRNRAKISLGYSFRSDLVLLTASTLGVFVTSVTLIASVGVTLFTLLGAVVVTFLTLALGVVAFLVILAVAVLAVLVAEVRLRVAM